MDGDGSAGELTEVDEALCGGTARTVEVTARCRDGRTFPAELRVGLLEGRAQRMFMALVRDVSERERSRERIEYLTGHDELTELPNGRLFSTQTEAAVERAGRTERQVAVLHVDLNRFSLVNQGLGSAGGDELLRQTAGRLREAARPMDVVARYAADEFLILAARIEPPARPRPSAARRAPDQLLYPPPQHRGAAVGGEAVSRSLRPLGTSLRVEPARPWRARLGQPQREDEPNERHEDGEHAASLPLRKVIEATPTLPQTTAIVPSTRSRLVQPERLHADHDEPREQRGDDDRVDQARPWSDQ